MNLGLMYHDGIGVKSDPVEAWKWFTLAQRNGEGIATHYLQELEDALTSEEKKEAERRADRFQEEFNSRKSANSRQPPAHRSEEHTSELQSLRHLVCRLLLEKKKKNT